MRQDQFEKLQQRAEELVDLFIEESDPSTWPGHGIAQAAMDRGTRGDRLWVKKSAVATLACAQRIIGLVDVVRAKTAAGAGPDDAGAVDDTDADDLEREVQAAMKEADSLAARVVGKIQKRAGHAGAG